MRCCDCQIWGARIGQEFSNQASQEAELGLPTAEFMRNLNNKVHSLASALILSFSIGSQVNLGVGQRGFIDFICTPLFTKFCTIFPQVKQSLVYLAENRAYYQLMAEGKFNNMPTANISSPAASPAPSPSLSALVPPASPSFAPLTHSPRGSARLPASASASSAAVELKSPSTGSPRGSGVAIGASSPLSLRDPRSLPTFAGPPPVPAKPLALKSALMVHHAPAAAASLQQPQPQQPSAQLPQPSSKRSVVWADGRDS